MKAFNHPNLFYTGARSVQGILQPEEHLTKNDEKIITPSIGQLEKRTSSRATDIWH